MIFHVVVSVYRLVKIWNSPQFPVELFRNGLYVAMALWTSQRCWDTWKQSSSRTGLLTYLGLEPLEGHGPSTTVCQRPQSWVICSNSLQVQPVCLASASRSLLQVFFGQPLFLFPWGFQVKAWRVMFVDGFLRVCPIHRHLLLLISSSAGTWLVLSQRSALLIVFGQWIFRISRSEIHQGTGASFKILTNR